MQIIAATHKSLQKPANKKLNVLQNTFVFFGLITFLPLASKRLLATSKLRPSLSDVPKRCANSASDCVWKSCCIGGDEETCDLRFILKRFVKFALLLLQYSILKCKLFKFLFVTFKLYTLLICLGKKIIYIF